MRAALAQVRAEQGPDAVILSSRRVDEGIEVIAAIDYDEALFVDATRLALRRNFGGCSQTWPRRPRRRRSYPAPLTALAPAPPPPDSLPATTPARPHLLNRRASREAPPSPPQFRGRRLTAMQRELKEMRHMLECGFAGGMERQRLREPLEARVLEELWVLGMSPDVAGALADPRRGAPDRRPVADSLALLVEHLPVVDGLSTVSGGIIAMSVRPAPARPPPSRSSPRDGAFATAARTSRCVSTTPIGSARASGS